MNSKSCKALRRYAKGQTKTPATAKKYYKKLKQEFKSYIREH